jgi:hypothetical protein
MRECRPMDASKVQPRVLIRLALSAAPPLHQCVWCGGRRRKIACGAGRGRLGRAAPNQDDARKRAHQGQQANAKHDGGQNAVLALGEKFLRKVVGVKEWLLFGTWATSDGKQVDK